MIDQKTLEAEVGRLLEILYAKRLGALDKLRLTKLLNKNPYLYRALGIEESLELLRQMQIAFVSSSDETIFGNEFFEPLALWAARESSGHSGGSRVVTVGDAAGIDIAITEASSYSAISVKSGKNIFNAQSSKGQSSEFEALQARLKKLGKQFLPYIGYGYGRKAAPKKATVVDRVAGEKFWNLLTGEQDFYLRIADAIGVHSIGHGAVYRKAFDHKCNSLVKEFCADFVAADGTIQWNKIVKFNSSIDKPKSLKKSRVKMAKADTSP